jgi:hypothetical protein
MAWGGARKGAGRPRKPRPKPAPAPKTDGFEQILAQVREYAEAGVEEATIVSVLKIDEAKLKAEGRLTAFREAVAYGQEVCRAELMLQIKRRSTRTRRNDGSVNALALRARNLLNWDRQGIQDEQKPDLSGARERLRLELQKLAANYEAQLGRPIEPEHVLFQDIFGRWPWEDGAGEGVGA